MKQSHSQTRRHIVIDARIRRSSTGRYVDRLLEHLQDLDDFHRYTVLVQPDDLWEPRNKNFRAVPCRFKQFSFNPFDELSFSLQIYFLKPDLVHFTMSQQPLLYFGNIVTTSHDTTMYRFVRRGSTPMPIYKLKIGLYRFMVWQAHRKSRMIIVPTQTVGDEFAKLQPFTKDKLVVTYEASEPPLPTKAEKPLKLDTKDQFIMYVGTAFPHKNLPKLIEAFDVLHAQRPELKLVIVGKHEKHYFELIDWAKTRPSYKNIIFTGFIPDSGLKWLYEHAAAYVFASLSEGFGLPPLEAMSHGAPVVSSKASCMPEVYGDAAYYFNPHSPKDIAEKVGIVLDDKKLREQLVKNGHAQLKKYSWRKMAEETLIIYKETLREN